MRKNYIACILMAIISLEATSCSASVSDHVANELKDQIENLDAEKDPYVQMVENGSPESYPDITYGQAFKDFFTSPTWKSFDGTPETEVSFKPTDGSQTRNCEVVEFTGECRYRGANVKARIQFTINEDHKTFTTSFLAFNEIPQTSDVLLQLLSTVFGQVKTAPQRSEASSVPASDTTVAIANDNSNSTVTYSPEDEILPSNRRRLTEKDLLSLTRELADLARNEIYARHGYVFRTPAYRNYFKRQDWYYEDPSYDMSLTKLEQENLDLIVAYEKKMGWRK